MFCVVYEFKIKPNCAAEFERGWSDFTEAIYRVCGSLGSRLHKTSDPLTYVAYAQWPSKEVFQKVIPREDYTDMEWASRDLMSSALDSAKKLHELEVCDDHLRHAQS